MRKAGFSKRMGATLIDIVPICIGVGGVYYLLLGFDQTLADYRIDISDSAARARFLRERNQIRDLSFLLWLLYSTLMDASLMQGTFGKAALGLRIVDKHGTRLSIGRATARNLAKILSYIPFGLGFLWVLVSKNKRGWHDSLSKTTVVRR
ncbi:MAG: putative RDD family membrane protein YckC [Planctomycetota bacterium]|jgi:uncharacterized RDD family membrane protein YckC